MNERVKFIAAFLEGNENFTELCERFGVSRKQGYKWRERYEAGGVEALRDQSRAPINSERFTADERVKAAVLAVS